MHFSIPAEAVKEICERHGVRKLAIFGSALRDDFHAESDVDMLVDYKPDQRVHFADLLALEDALSDVVGRKVDLGEFRSVEEDPNYLRRKEILGSAQVIYEA